MNPAHSSRVMARCLMRSTSWQELQRSRTSSRPRSFSGFGCDFESPHHAVAASISGGRKAVGRSVTTSIPGDFEIALGGPLGPGAGDRAIVRADVIELPVDHHMNGIPALILAVSLKVD